MTEFNQEDIRDRLDNLDLLRELIVGEQPEDYQDKINELETQIDQMREEMRVQGNEVQNTLNQKIEEVLKAIQISQFSASQPIVDPKPQAIAAPPTATPLPPPRSQPAQKPRPIAPPPPPAVKRVDIVPEPVPKVSTESDFTGFFDQINSILQDNPDSSAAEAIAPPPPPLPQFPVNEKISIPEPAPTPIKYSSEPISDPPETKQHLTVVAEDETAQIHNLQNILLDEEVTRLRQNNSKLDFKLRQVEEYLSSVQQPMNTLLPLLTELLQLKIQETKTLESTPLSSEKKRFSWLPIFYLLFLLILIPLGLYGYWLRREYVIERDVTIALTSTPALSLYRLSADVKGNQLYLTGTVPSETLRDRATEIAASTAPELTLRNNILVTDTQLDPVLIRDEINKIIEPLNAISGIQIKPEVDGDRLTLSGTVLKKEDIPAVIKAVENISGISQIINNIQVQIQPISVRLYFDQNSAAVKPDDLQEKLTLIKRFLAQHPNLNLHIIGYQHPTESAHDVALKRAQATQLLLEDQGGDRRRIIALGVNQSPPNITAEDPIWLSRTVLFEITPSTP